MRHHTISNTDDIIDSRDVIARIEELEAARDAHEMDCPTCHGYGHARSMNDVGQEEEYECPDCLPPGENSGTDASRADWALDWPDDAAELAALKAFAEELSGYLPDWRHGETLIRDDYFTTYAQELAEDCGDMPKTEGGWPMQFVTIDWDAAADALKQDYTSAEWDGVTYWGRS